MADLDRGNGSTTFSKSACMCSQSQLQIKAAALPITTDGGNTTCLHSHALSSQVQEVHQLNQGKISHSLNTVVTAARHLSCMHSERDIQ